MRKMPKISVTTSFWPKNSKTLGKIAWTGSLDWPLFASLLFLEVDLRMVSEEMKPLVRFASCLVTSSSPQLPLYCVPGSKDCCYIRMIFFHFSIAHCWLTGLILLGQQWSRLLDCSASPRWPEQGWSNRTRAIEQVEMENKSHERVLSPE